MEYGLSVMWKIDNGCVSSPCCNVWVKEVVKLIEVSIIDEDRVRRETARPFRMLIS